MVGTPHGRALDKGRAGCYSFALGERLISVEVALDTPQPKPPRSETAERLLDAAERLLVEVGHGGISTRRLAAEAGANQGLVHYYFGSIDELFVQVLERFTDRLVSRQRAMYTAEGRFIDKWRTAWRFQEEDLRGGYSKIWMELQA